MIRKYIDYAEGKIKLKGYLAHVEDVSTKRPLVLVVHAWRGQDDFARKKAEDLANLGYVGFAVDLYGEGKSVETNEEALALMLPLFVDRSLLQKRILAGLHAVSDHPFVDPSKIAAIGFCFGGLTVIELLRSGADIRGCVSFHGVFRDKMGDHVAKRAPPQKMHGSLLVLHGHDDPLVSLEDILSLQTEFTQAHVDWQMHIYGHCMHAFTNPQADEKSSGLLFDKKASKRSWISMKDFFQELFNQ